MARHSNPKEGGYVTQNELLNMGNSIREYLKHHKEPFIDHNGGRVYEWENKDGIRFRIVVGNRTKPNKGSTTAVESKDLPLFDNRIITFYSDRNLNEKMQFRNPKLNQAKQTDSNPLSEFGKNYQEFYHKGKEAIKKLLQTKSGQVQGAFYRPDIGDITLVWGKEGTGKSDGFGLAKIAKFHPEVVDKLDNLVVSLPIKHESERQIILDDGFAKIVIRKTWEKSGKEENIVCLPNQNIAYRIHKGIFSPFLSCACIFFRVFVFISQSQYDLSTS